MTLVHPETSTPGASRNGRTHVPRLTRPAAFLRRGNDAVQVGIDTADAVLLAGVDPALADVLRLIDGRHTLPSLQLAARRLRVPERQLDQAIAILRHAGLIEIQTGPPVDETARSIDQDGSTPADHTLAGARLQVVGTKALGTALAGALTRSGASIVPAERWTAAQNGRTTALTIVATDAAEPDRVLAAGLVRADQPHLIVRTSGDQAIVGPLVRPGHTACLRCIDLTRTDADPAWPELLAQLCRSRVPAPEVLTGWAVGTALVQISAALRYLGVVPPGRRDDDPAPPETLSATVELTGADLIPRLRRWSSHPGCGCGWSRSAE